MTNFLTRAARRWALCAATGFALAPAGSFAADPNAPNEGPSAIERELQKLYERDGRKMPPMRKPVVPPPGQKPAIPQQRQSAGAPSVMPPSNAQPMTAPKSNGVMQRINPFNRKTTGEPANTVSPPASEAPRSAAATTPARPTPPAPPPSSLSAQLESETPATIAANEFEPPPSNRPSAPAPTRPTATRDEFDNPFPDESEDQADRGRRPAAPPTERPAAPATSAPTSRSDSPPTPPGRAAEDNPFTGLKLDTPPAPRSAPEVRRPAPSVKEAPSAQEPAPRPMPTTAANANPFEAPVPAERAPRERATPKPSAPESTAPNPSAAPFGATPPTSSEPRSLTVPDNDPFELPTPRKAAPESRPTLSAPSIPNPPSLEAPGERPVLTAPPRQEAGPSLGGASEDRPQTPERSQEPATRPALKTPSLPRVEPRVQPPKQLNPEPAAELPRNPQNDHERKLRLIAERRGTGFKGFCPVTLREERDLVDASSEFTSTFDGVTYSFASEQAKAAFDRNPLKYVPAAGGNDVIIQGSKGHQVPGSLDYAVWYKDRLHLFSSRDTLETFIETLSTTSAPKP